MVGYSFYFVENADGLFFDFSDFWLNRLHLKSVTTLTQQTISVQSLQQKQSLH